MILALIAQLAPVIEAVIGRRGRNVMFQGSSSGKARLFAGLHLDGWAAARSFPFTFPHGCYAGIPVRIDIKTVLAGFLHGERHIGRIHFEDFALVQTSDVQVERSLMQFHLDAIVADVGQRQTALTAQAQNAVTYVQLGAGVFVSPHIVRVGQRTVHRSLHPIARPLRLNRNRARRVLQTSHTARRVRLGAGLFTQLWLWWLSLGRLTLGGGGV